MFDPDMIKEQRDRWEKVEQLAEKLSSKDNPATTERLVMLLVEYLRPMHPSQEQFDQVTAELGNLMDALGNK